MRDEELEEKITLAAKLAYVDALNEVLKLLGTGMTVGMIRKVVVDKIAGATK